MINTECELPSELEEIIRHSADDFAATMRALFEQTLDESIDEVKASEPCLAHVPREVIATIWRMWFERDLPATVDRERPGLEAHARQYARQCWVAEIADLDPIGVA